MHRLLSLWIVLASATSLFAQLDFGPERKDDVTPPTELPDVLKPKSGRSEAEEDRLTAAAHFAQAAEVSRRQTRDSAGTTSLRNRGIAALKSLKRLSGFGSTVRTL